MRVFPADGGVELSRGGRWTHPTGIFPAGILVTEGCRGDGGLLKDGEGHRFMPDYEPEKKELASRDVVSRRMEEHIAKGKGAKPPGAT